MQGAQNLRSEAYLLVRCNDEGEAQRRRWTFYEAIKFDGFEIRANPLLKKEVRLLYTSSILKPCRSMLLIGPSDALERRNKNYG